MSERDRIGVSANGVKAVVAGVRTVRNDRISINGHQFVVRGFKDDLNGRKVRITPIDYLASEYDVLDFEDYHRVGTAEWLSKKHLKKASDQ